MVARREAINEDALRELGARGVVKLGSDGLQVVLGPIADQIAGDIRTRLGVMRRNPVVAPASAADIPVVPPSAAIDPAIVAQILNALGGAGNIKRIEGALGRVLISVLEATAVNETVSTIWFNFGV